MTNVHIVYYNYLTPDGNQMSIGGIQTYITNLISVLHEFDTQVFVHQLSILDFRKDIGNVTVLGYRIPKGRFQLKKFVYEVQKKICCSSDLTIIACDTCAVSSFPGKTIGIQHGIFWDKPDEICSNLKYFYIYIKKAIQAWRTIKRIGNVEELVCVDYNFINWYRALVPYPKVKLHAILNFCRIPNALPVKPNVSEGINIIFARRFFPYRGTRIFASALTRLLQEYSFINLTIAGEGPDEFFLRKAFKNFRVNFIKYDSGESLKIHENQHIALVPTLGSEGTSLSLLEAMASGCACVCTNVGGMTNIVLDHFNGLMISPNDEDLYNALKKLVLDSDLRNTISQNAYETVSSTFGLENWKESWRRILQNKIHD